MKLVKDSDNKIIETPDVSDKEAEQAFKIGSGILTFRIEGPKGFRS